MQTGAMMTGVMTGIGTMTNGGDITVFITARKPMSNRRRRFITRRPRRLPG
jgi:hypothetical protein